jgi:hypothetical protein
MTVEHDQGVYRHLQFRGEGRQDWFDIITAPEILTINGDYGTYTFSRNHDMFGFFRQPDGEPITVNTDYWKEKCIAWGHEQVEKHTHAAFWGPVVYEFRQREYRGEEMWRLWYELREAIEHSEDDEWGAVESLRNLDAPYWDWCDGGSMKEYSYHYLWCLWAIVWGIRHYDYKGRPL